MPYRFVLEVPEGVHQDAKIAVEGSDNASILIERHPHTLDPTDEFAELTVVTHTLDVIDSIYAWADATSLRHQVFVTAHRGPRVNLEEQDARTLRRMIQGDQYWYGNTVPRLTHRVDPVMEGGALVADVPYGGRLAESTAIAPAETTVDLGSIDNVAINVLNVGRAEGFYRDFFGMDVIYRARRDEDRWEHLEAGYDYGEGLREGVEPEIVRLENGPVSLVLINVGMGKVLHEPRVAYISVSVSLETLQQLRGKALFRSFTIQEDSPRAFRFVDPFGVVWQLVAANA